MFFATVRFTVAKKPDKCPNLRTVGNYMSNCRKKRTSHFSIGHTSTQMAGETHSPIAMLILGGCIGTSPHHRIQTSLGFFSSLSIFPCCPEKKGKSYVNFWRDLCLSTTTAKELIRNFTWNMMKPWKTTRFFWAKFEISEFFPHQQVLGGSPPAVWQIPWHFPFPRAPGHRFSHNSSQGR